MVNDHFVSPTQSDIYHMLYWYNWLSWCWARGCLKHVENWNKYVEKKCASSWSFTKYHNKIHGKQNIILMFQVILSDGLTQIPTVFYPVILNALWHMITGLRYSTKEHGEARYFAEQAFRTQRSVDITGDALAQTPWIRFFAPYYSGFTDLMDSIQKMLKVAEVMPSLVTLEEWPTSDKFLQFPT